MGGKLVHLNGTSGGYCGPGRPRLYAAETRERALKLARAGMPKTDIARRLGVHVSSVKEWCRRAEVEARDEMPDMLHEFGAWVRASRALRGWTQHDLARRVGATQGAISHIERAGTAGSLRMAVRIIDAFEGEEVA